MIELYKHQIDFLKDNSNKTSLVWSCGTGKTRTAIEWAKGISVLVICPKSLVTNWVRESEKWYKKDFGVLVLSKEEFRRDHKKLQLFTQIIVDEVHNGFLTPNFKS